MRITELAIKHTVSVFVLVLVLILGGTAAYNSLPREAAPEIEIPVIVITTIYPGVSPEDVEGLITRPIEQELKDINNIDELRSTSAEGASTVIVEFTTKANLDEALQNVRDKVALAKPKLPADAEEPIIQEINTSDFPMLIVNITGDQDLVRLRDIGEDLQDRIEGIQGVMEVTLSGGLEREIQVWIDPVRLNHRGIALDAVVNAVARENATIPGGEIKMGDASYLVRVPGEFTSVPQLEDVPIKLRGDHAIYLKDVATVVDGYKDVASMSRLDQRTNISLSVTKRPGANIISVADNIKAMLKEQQASLPGDVRTVILGDQSKDIRDMVKELQNNMASGLILVVAVIMIAMGLRNSLLVALAIPLSMLISFLVIDGIGLTLNMIVLFSLILALGMLVDNAIVIVENIYRHASEAAERAAAHGHPTDTQPAFEVVARRVRAAVVGTREVAWPVATSTFTTLAAFFPLLFWPGVDGKFMGYMPQTLIITLAASLFVALIITPVLCSVFLRPGPLRRDGADEAEAAEGSSKAKGAPASSRGHRGKLKHQWQRFAGFILALYERSLRAALNHRARTVVVGSVMFVGTFVLYGAAKLGVEFFPDVTPRKIFLHIDTGDGATLGASDRVVRQIEAHLGQAANVKHFVADVGSPGSAANFGGGGHGVPHQSRISADFVDPDDTVEPVERTIDGLRRFATSLPGAKFEVKKEDVGPPQAAPVTIELSGDDMAQLGRLSSQLQQRLAGIPGLVDLRDDFAVGRPELRVRIDRERAGVLNVNTQMVASTVRTAINGTKASVFRDGKDEYDITVRLAPEFRESLDDLEHLRINVGSRRDPDDIYLIPLGEVAQLSTAAGTGAIAHKELKRVVTIEGNVQDRLPNEVISDVQARAAGFKLPHGYTLTFTGQQADQAETEQFLGKAFMTALFLIALILVTQFNSVVLPLTIMLAVILSLVGVLWGQLICQMPFGIIMTGLGVISLAGVVVNNGIVLVDTIRRQEDAGLPRLEALVTAGRVRLRPVVLTAVTTVLGLIPMAVGVGFDFTEWKWQVGGQTADFWQPMAIAVIFGLLIATVLTLVIVPVLYSLLSDLEDWVRAKAGRPPAHRAAHAHEAAMSGQHTAKTGLVLLAVVGAVVAGPRAGWAASAYEAAATPEPAAEPAAETTATTLTLEQALDQATSTSPTAIMVQARFKQAISQSRQTWPYVLPTVTVSGTYTRYNQEIKFGEPGNEVLFQKEWQPSAAAQLRWLLFDARLVPALLNAGASEKLAAMDRDQAKAQLRYGTAVAYYQAVTAGQQVATQENFVQVTQAHLERAQARYKLGAVAQTDVLRAKAEAAIAKQALAQAEAAASGARRALAAIMGWEGPKLARADFRVARPKQGAGTVYGAKQTSAGSAHAAGATHAADPGNLRLDVKMAELQVTMANRRVLRSWLDFAPALVMNGRLNWTNPSGFAGRDTTWQVGLSLEWEIFSGGRSILELQEHRHTATLATQQLRQKQQAQTQEWADAMAQLQAAAASLQAAKQQLAFAHEAAAAIQTRYRLGNATQLDALEANRAQTDAARNLTIAQLQHDLALLTLDHLRQAALPTR